MKCLSVCSHKWNSIYIEMASIFICADNLSVCLFPQMKFNLYTNSLYFHLCGQFYRGNYHWLQSLSAQMKLSPAFICADFFFVFWFCAKVQLFANLEQPILCEIMSNASWENKVYTKIYKYSPFFAKQRVNLKNGESINIEYPSSLKFVCRVFKQIKLTKSKKQRSYFLVLHRHHPPTVIIIQIKTGQNQSVPANKKKGSFF